MRWVPGLTVRILTHERAKVGQTTIVDALMHLVRARRLAGMTVCRAIEGMSEHGSLRMAHALDSGLDMPLAIEITDRHDLIESLLTEFAACAPSGVLTVYDTRLYIPPAHLIVRDVMAPVASLAHPDEPLTALLDVLLDTSARLIPVVSDSGAVQGVLTLGSLVEAAGPEVVSGISAPEGIRSHLAQVLAGMDARDAMIAPARVVRVTDSVPVAAEYLLQHHVTEAPVIDANGQVVGTVRERRLASAIVSAVDRPSRGDHPAASDAGAAHVDETPTAADKAERDVPTIADSAGWGEIQSALQQSPSCMVLVVDQNGHLRGMIDERTVLSHALPESTGGMRRILGRVMRESPAHILDVLHRASPRNDTAAAVMVPAPAVVSADLPVAEALARIARLGDDAFAVVVIEHMEPLGILWREDALRAVIRG